MQVKQVIIIRRDLKMRRGKEIAQGSHASIAFLLEKIKGADTILKKVYVVVKFSLSKEFFQWITKTNIS